MNINLEKIFLIMSKDEKLIAEGVPRNRYICHIGEKTNKRILSYNSKKKAESGFKDSGFYISKIAEDYIKETYPDLVNENRWVSWRDIIQLFEAREFTVKYESV